MDHEDPTAHFALAHKGPMVHPGLYLGKMCCGAFMGWTNLVGQTLYSLHALSISANSPNYAMLLCNQSMLLFSKAMLLFNQS